MKNKQLKLLSTILEDNKLKFNFLNDFNIKPKDIIVEDIEGNIYPKPTHSTKNKILEVVIDIDTTIFYFLLPADFGHRAANGEVSPSGTWEDMWRRDGDQPRGRT